MLPTIVFWQNELSLHQESLIQELGKEYPNPIWVVTNKGVPDRRKAQGWKEIDYGSAKIIITRDLREREKIIDAVGTDSIHIVSGLGREKTLAKTQDLLAKKKRRIGFYLEPWADSSALRGIALWCFYLWRMLRTNSNRTFFLTTGSRGKQQLHRIGVKEDRIFSFGYFLKEREPTGQEITQLIALPDGPVKILFVGELNTNKQILLTANEVVKNPFHNLKLSIVGDGVYRSEIEALAKKNPNRIEYLGSVSNEQSRKIMRLSDFLILPSLYDGWGAVISESLTEGTPVLASRACGASQLVTKRIQGFVLEPGAEGITEALAFADRNGNTSSEVRLKLQTWARKNLTGEAGAKYLIDILKYQIGEESVRPVAPWQKLSSRDGI